RRLVRGVIGGVWHLWRPWVRCTSSTCTAGRVFGRQRDQEASSRPRISAARLSGVLFGPELPASGWRLYDRRGVSPASLGDLDASTEHALSSRLRRPSKRDPEQVAEPHTIVLGDRGLATARRPERAVLPTVRRPTRHAGDRP